MPKLKLLLACLTSGSSLAIAPAKAQPDDAVPAAGDPSGTSEWSVHPIGRLEYDVGWVSSPQGISDPDLGSDGILRRARLGFAGKAPGGVRFWLEADFADHRTDVASAFVGYRVSDRLEVVVGQHRLAQLSSARFATFMERPGFTEAYNFVLGRGVGLSTVYSAGPVIAAAGAFTVSVDDFERVGPVPYGFSGRLVLAPRIGEKQLHFGVSAHYRRRRDLIHTGDTVQYRRRPIIRTTDVRFLETSPLAVEDEMSYGLEAAVIRAPFHVAAEMHWLRPDRAGPGPTPSFFGGYLEVGYYLTGESHGYGNAQFAGTKVRKPVGRGGIGAVQINFRYDRLDLSHSGGRGGIENGYLAALVWIPRDNFRFLLNYGRLQYRDAAIPAAGGSRDYGIDVIGGRAQLDF